MEVLKDQSHRLLEEPPRPKSSPAIEITPAVDDVSRRKHELDKRSLDYVLRSGLAGGLAGCAVGLLPLKKLDSSH